MKMIAKQGPCVAGSGTSNQQFAKALKKSIAIAVVSKDGFPFDSSDDYMVQRPWSIYS
jgi:hypothetical protein